MKKPEEIRTRIADIEKEMDVLKKRYLSLGQIEMQSATGNELARKLDFLDGFKAGLLYVVAYKKES